LARRVLQFPVRNAFAPQRSHDSLARDPDAHAQRIVEQVNAEMVRKAERQATGRVQAFENARTYGVTTMPSPRRAPLSWRRLMNSILAFVKREAE